MKEEKIVLTLSSEYLGHWTVYDALRELYQNVFDRQEEDENASWFSENTKNSEGVSLLLGNKATLLDRKTLILGVTSKKDDKNAIGKFGEGYKLAILVLLRNSIKVSLVTGHEQWTFGLEHVPQFGMKMLVVTIKQLPISKQSHDLIFKIVNIPVKAWNSYSQFNLRLQPKIKLIVTDTCDVLLDKRNRGKIFVGGLYICKYVGSSIYGYDFHPDVFPLGRDRNIIEGFSANWEAARALTQATVENVKVLNNVVDNISKSDDTRFMSSFTNSSSVLIDALWNKFIIAYPDTLPVDSEWRSKSLQKEYVSIKLTIVTEREYEVLCKSKGYKEAKKVLEERPPAPTPEEIVNGFYDKHVDKMSKDLMSAFANELMTEAINWKVVE